ncbi:family 20 glycosylhydrolase [Spirosoma sp. KCTC 42546]|uniref:family 20 glycosylhydrolase n=1 Tax=Spirosoma sp. KCTC 42546 TaxID=2520506 RepID=UPI001157E2E0|nr:family 20 glycosylhydrolase [Spirosoma sp. KCTC 42546]QDK77708.1 family 20 glycosylhydrolase [Spirosoma sp. KCTC 42546]
MIRLHYLLLALFVTLSIQAQDVAQRYPLIPYPTSLTPASGQFVVTAQTALIVQDSRFENEARQLQALLEPGLGKRLSSKGNSSKIVLQYDASITNPEGYDLTITPQQVTLKASQPVGMFRAVQTIRQLLPVAIEKATKPLSSITIPAVQIRDQPAYAWRGMHLDVSRHFYSMDYLHTFIDRLALYKFNKFHLHLTDDQGWRLEIKAYPKLTSEGAWRTYNNQDSVVLKRAVTNPDFDLPKQFIRQQNGQTQYGGFYTQAQMRDLIAYAAARHVEIIPEIDMPGHLTAAIKAYPFLSCTGQEGWGKTFSVPICPCNEPTYTFMETVLSEVIALFPSPYVHIGADEVEKSTWAQSAGCQELMKRENIKNVEELQSYFVHRIEKFVQSKGKKLMVWDDALEGGLKPSTAVMYWRSWVKDAPHKAAQNGNDVVMTPVSNLYFDSPPGIQSVENIYNLNVVPERITAGQTKQFLGAQANIWTEYIPTENRVDYMSMPRMTALAEVVWTAKKDYSSYQKRLLQHFLRMEQLGIHYRLPDLTGFAEENVFVDQATLRIKKPLDSYSLRYTTDGSNPQSNSPELPGGLSITKPQTVKVAAFTPSGVRGDVYSLRYQQQAYATPVTIANPQAGLTSSYFKKYFKETKLMKQQTPDSTYTINNVVVPKSVNAPSFGIQFRGYLTVPETGVYSFFYTCDDGGILRIADRMVVDNDGNHFPIEKSGQVALQKGAHPFEADFIEGGGGFTLKLKYSLNGSEPMDIPDSWFGH